MASRSRTWSQLELGRHHDLGLATLHVQHCTVALVQNGQVHQSQSRPPSPSTSDGNRKSIRPNAKHQAGPHTGHVMTGHVMTCLVPDGCLVPERLTTCLMTVGENFPSSRQVRPSAAAAGRRAGPVLAPLRAAGPAAAHTKRPDDPRMEVLRPSGLAQSDHVVGVRPGRPSPQPILVTVNHHRSRPLTRPWRDHAAREPGPEALARKDWPLRRQALGMILRVLRGRDQRQVRMLRGDLGNARRPQQCMRQLLPAVGLG
jgi:hypothetical protein